MPTPLAVILGLFLLFVLYVVYHLWRAGPAQLPERNVTMGVVVQKATVHSPGRGWESLGSKTTARGLDLLFEHDDDPEAEASFFVEGERESRGSLANRVTVKLTPELQTRHVHTRGWVLRVRVRGTEPVVGKEIRIQMNVRTGGSPLCGKVENDDGPAAVGGWIEFESLEILKMRR